MVKPFRDRLVTGSAWGTRAGRRWGAVVAALALSGVVAGVPGAAWAASAAPGKHMAGRTASEGRSTTQGRQLAVASLKGTSHARGRPGTQYWVSRYNGSGNGDDVAKSVAVSPDGATVFVTGYSIGGASTGYDYATIAYNASTGTQRWVSRYNGPANGTDEASSVAVSPDGGTVFVTGFSDGGASSTDYATVAYDTANGAVRWVSRYNGPANGADAATSMVVSPDGGTVLVTGYSDGGPSTGTDYATVAYNAANGAVRWVSRYNGPANGDDEAISMAISPDGGTVFVTGHSNGGTSTHDDYATVAYNAATGAQRWVSRYNGPANGPDVALAVAVSSDGGTVFVTGYSDGGASTGDDYATVAYHAATGAQRWVSRYNGPANGADVALALAVSPKGKTVFVTGYSDGGASTGTDYATIAYKG